MNVHELKLLWQKTLPMVEDWDLLPTATTYRPPPSSTEPETLPASGGETPETTYTTLNELGRGGMGVVCRARQNCLAREVAAKSLNARNASTASRAAFLAEARLTARLEHPNIVPVHDLALRSDGEWQLIMKLVDGRPWSELLRARESPDLIRELEILIQVCNAVAFAHSRGVIHNDLKPGNVMVGSFGEVLLLDWGLAACFRDDEATCDLRHRSAIDRPCGTPAYMAPELAEGRGSELNPRSDVYALGGILYRILSGKPPHGSLPFLQAIYLAIQGLVPPLSDEQPAELRDLCARALSLDPGKRPASAGEFAQSLKDFLRHKESLAISDRAERELHSCSSATEGVDRVPEVDRQKLYEGFAEAVHGFHEAEKLWSGNDQACRGGRAARLAFAEAALAHGDLVLAQTQAGSLEGNDAVGLRERIRQEVDKKRRERRTRRRLRTGLGVSAALLVALLAGTAILFLVFNRQLQREVGAATEARSLAERRQGELRIQKEHSDRKSEINADLLDRLSTVLVERFRDSYGDARTNRAAQDILQVALEGWRQLRDADMDENRTTVESARARLQIGEILLELDGREGEARVEYSTALEALSDLRRNAPENADVEIAYARALFQMARLDRRGGDGDLAESRLGEALAILQAQLREQPSDRQNQRLVAVIIGDLANLYADLGRIELAIQRYEEQLALLDALARSGETSVTLRESQGLGFTGLAMARAKMGSLQAATESFHKGLVFFRELVAEDSTRFRSRRLLSNTLRGLAAVLIFQERLEEAEAVTVENLAVERGLLSLDPSSSTTRADYSAALKRRGSVEQNLGKLTEARALFEEAVKLDRSRMELEPANSQVAADYAAALRKLSAIACEQGRLVEAEQLSRRGVDLLLQKVASDSQDMSALRGLGISLARSGDLANARGRYTEAGERYSAAVAAFEKVLAADSSQLIVRDDLAKTLRKEARRLQCVGRLDLAEAMLVESRAHSRAIVLADPSNITSRIDSSLIGIDLASVLGRVGKEEEARKLTLDCLGDLRSLYRERGRSMAIKGAYFLALISAGDFFLGSSEPNRAEVFLRVAASLGAQAARYGDEPLHFRQYRIRAWEQLAELLLTQGKLNLARMAAQHVVTLATRLLAGCPENRNTSYSLCGSLLQLARAVLADGDLRRAAFLQARAENAARELVRRGQDDPVARDILARSLELKGDLLLESGLARRAAALIARLVPPLRREGSRESRDTQLRRRITARLFSLGKCYSALGDLPEALRVFDRALVLFRRQPQELRTLGDLAAAWGFRGECLLRLGRAPDARRCFLTALDLNRRALAWHQNDANARSNLMWNFLHLGNVEQLRKRPSEAVLYFKQALKIARELASTDPQDRQKMSTILYYLQQAEEEKRIELFLAGERQPETPRDFADFGLGLYDSGRYTEALDAFRTAFSSGMAPETCPHLFTAARSAARASTVPGDSGKAAGDALRWLAIWLRQLRDGLATLNEECARNPTEQNMRWRATRLGYWTHARDREEAFAGLRRTAEFQALFTDPPEGIPR